MSTVTQLRIAAVRAEIVLGLAALRLAGQTTVAVHVADVARQGFATRSDTIDLFGTNRRRYIGYTVNGVARSQDNHRPVYLFTTNYVGGGNEHLFQSDTLAVDSATFAPLWRRFHSRSDSASLVFRGRHATGWALRNGRRVTVDHDLSPDAVDGSLTRWIMGTLPLRPGYAASLAVFNAWSNSEAYDTLVVIRSEQVTNEGTTKDAWVVRWRPGVDVWIDKQSGTVLQEHDSNALGGRGLWSVRRETNRRP